jgi:hypothetical protein
MVKDLTLSEMLVDEASVKVATPPVHGAKYGDRGEIRRHDTYPPRKAFEV